MSPAGQEIALRQAIDDLVARWVANGLARSRRAINSGPCRDFAEDLIALLAERHPGLTVTLMDTSDLPLDAWTAATMSHCWVMCGDLAYDAERPGGCQIEDLPFFRRNGMQDTIAAIRADQASSSAMESAPTMPT